MTDDMKPLSLVFGPGPLGPLEIWSLLCIFELVVLVLCMGLWGPSSACRLTAPIS